MAVAGGAGPRPSQTESPRIRITPSAGNNNNNNSASMASSTSTLPSPTLSAASRQLAALSPYSLEACLQEAQEVWRRDLRSLFNHAADRFPDVGWTVPAEGQSEAGHSSYGGHVPFSSAHSVTSSVASLGGPHEETIWAHKAILYARAPNTFQARYLNLRSASEKLGHLANSSNVSLPSIRTSNEFHNTRPAWARRRTIRGAAPPSSFGMPRAYNGATSVTSDSEDDAGAQPGRGGLRHFDSRDSLSSSVDRPDSRASFAGSSDGNNLGYDTASVSNSSITSTDSASTIRPPLNLEGISTDFFSSILEYLYTAEESMVEAFEFLYQDRISLGGSPEERVEKLQQDFVFMWRSKLFSDVTISLSPDGARAIRSIPDAAASAISLATTATNADAHSVAGDEETSTFSTHRMVLVSRSPYFASQLLGRFSDSHATTLHLPSPPFTPASVHFTLGFLYTGTLFFSNRTFDLTTAFQLWRSGQYLQVDTLKSVVSALITKQFCHDFSCSPPCKSCVKRVPRTLAFTCCPDVSEPRLRSSALAAVAGEHFGAYWAKEVGNLDYTARGAIVADLCARVESNPALMVPTLRQLSIVGAKIDTERTSKWIEALRWMCESVEGRLRDLLEAQFEVIVASPEWTQLLDGVTFMRDVLDKALVMLVDGLNERRAAKIYQILVGTVLLREDGFAVDSIRQAIEDGRSGILRFLKRRWIGIRSLAGFNGLERWCLKEISHEIDVPEQELLLPEQEAATVSPAKKPPKLAVLRTASGGRPAASRQPSSEEREAGPINMRAQVLNRNAARATVVAATSRPADEPRTPRVSNTATAAGPSSSGAKNTSGPSLSTPPRSRTSSAASSSSASRTRPNAPTRAMSTASQSSSASASATRKPTAPTRAMSTASLKSNASSSTAPKRAESVASQASTLSTASRTSTTLRSASLRPSAVSPSPGGRRTPTNSSIAPTPTTPTTPSRKLSAPGVTPKAGTKPPITPTKTHSYLKATPKPVAPAASPGGSKTASGSSALAPRSRTTSAASSITGTPVKRSAVGTVKAPMPPAAAAKAAAAAKKTAAVLSPSAALAANTASKEKNSVGSEAPIVVDQVVAEKEADEELVRAVGTPLILGIPCIISPRNSQTGKTARLRATVKYIGPIKGRRGSWLGVEVPYPLPAGVEDSSLGTFNDGSDDGYRYFGLGVPPPPSDEDLVMSEVDSGDATTMERQARRRRIAGVVRAASMALNSGGTEYQQDRSSAGSASPGTDEAGLSPDSAGAPPSAKRLKNIRGGAAASLAMKRQLSAEREAPGETRGLFIRPNEVLFVVTPDAL
ncbi:hypothetical protein OC846_004454 [Tilletia horrida]|uniref:BTB domain-containing protein n=1 Tax=Tilletia horrida TaxID=155126 RepID=A0AAN6JQT4_9BASI|nr:hypothetical protein OC846_004454 [Tilletia horrida]KAK0565381.1 hypothetical protein OC861_003793 [Tilletia horrida]